MLNLLLDLLLDLLLADWLRSFLRTWFPWSVCGSRCKSLEPDPGPDGEAVDPKRDHVRCLGFLLPPLGEWMAIAVGLVLNLAMS